jgi:Uncharacterised nucleotidyltransferase
MLHEVPVLGRKERELLITCARVDLAPPQAERARELVRRGVDWDTIVLFAETHSVAPLLHSHLKELSGAGPVPKEAQRRLLQLSHRAGYHNRQYSQALRELLQLFAKGGVPTIVLKGLSLVELIYRNFSLRPLIDLNLLVPRARIDAARRLTRQARYVETFSRRSRFYRWCYSQLFLVKPEHFRVNLLLQWHVVSWPRMHAIDLGRLWREAERVRLSGAPALIPSPVDFALYLCLQADKYAFLNGAAVGVRDPAEFIFDEWTQNRLIRFTDVYELLHYHRATLDWDLLIARAKASGIEGTVYSVLRWVDQLFGPAIDPLVLQRLQPDRPRSVRRAIFRILAEPRDRALPPTFATRIRDWWLARGVPAQRRLIKLLGIAEYVFPRREQLRRRYARGWGAAAPLAYVYHTGGGLLRCILHVIPWTFGRLKASAIHRVQIADGPAPAGRALPSAGVGSR